MKATVFFKNGEFHAADTYNVAPREHRPPYKSQRSWPCRLGQQTLFSPNTFINYLSKQIPKDGNFLLLDADFLYDEPKTMCGARLMINKRNLKNMFLKEKYVDYFNAEFPESHGDPERVIEELEKRSRGNAKTEEMQETYRSKVIVQPGKDQDLYAALSNLAPTGDGKHFNLSAEASLLIVHDASYKIMGYKLVQEGSRWMIDQNDPRYSACAKSFKEIPKDEKFLGVILGYGIENASRFARLQNDGTLGKIDERNSGDEIQKKWNGEKIKLMQAGSITIPSCRVWSGEESEELLQKFLGESAKIKKLLEHELSLNENINKNPATTVTKFFSNALLGKEALSHSQGKRFRLLPNVKGRQAAAIYAELKQNAGDDVKDAKRELGWRSQLQRKSLSLLAKNNPAISEGKVKFYNEGAKKYNDRAEKEDTWRGR